MLKRTTPHHAMTRAQVATHEMATEAMRSMSDEDLIGCILAHVEARPMPVDRKRLLSRMIDRQADADERRDLDQRARSAGL